MEAIGIKLADGSFYPILEYGKPQKKNLALTTVKDNQTTVHVDLYRSSTASMADAQYVDTLEIKDLHPHGNGEPNLNLDIELDAENKLSAKIHDPETDRQVALVSRPIAERGGPVNFSIDDSPAGIPSEEDTKTFEDIFDGKNNEPEPSFEDILNSISSDTTASEQKPYAITEDDVAKLDKDVTTTEVTSLGPAPDDEDFGFDALPKEGKSSRRSAKSRHQEGDEKEAGEVPEDFDESLFTDDSEQPEVLQAAEPAATEEKAAAVTTLNDSDTTDFDFAATGNRETAASIELPDFNEPDASSSINTETDFDFGDTQTAVPAKEIDDTIAQADSEFTESELTSDIVSDDELLNTDSDLSATVQTDSSLSDNSLSELPDFTLDDIDTSDVDLSKDIDLPALPDFGDGIGASTELETTAAASDFDLDLPDFGELETETSSRDFDLPDFGDTEKATADSDFDLSLPDFSDDDDSSIDSADLPDFSDPEIEASSEASSDDFDLPDFGDLSTTTNSYLASDTDFEIPSFDDDESESDFDRLFGEDGNKQPEEITPENMFNNLYDKETIEGKSSSAFEEEKREEKKKTRLPVIICVACAIICLLCLLFLFVIPTKLNLINRPQQPEIAARTQQEKGSSSTPIADAGNITPPIDTSSLPSPEQKNSTEETTPSFTPATSAPAATPTPKQAESVPAKENQIVIATVPSQVVPEQPVKSATKVPDIKYTVVWGDTLWDISNAYYKNPWRYKYLAQYNKLSNPNYIKAGSVILIPAE